MSLWIRIRRTARIRNPLDGLLIISKLQDCRRPDRADEWHIMITRLLQQSPFEVCQPPTYVFFDHSVLIRDSPFSLGAHSLCFLVYGLPYTYFLSLCVSGEQRLSSLSRWLDRLKSPTFFLESPPTAFHFLFLIPGLLPTQSSEFMFLFRRTWVFYLSKGG